MYEYNPELCAAIYGNVKRYQLLFEEVIDDFITEYLGDDPVCLFKFSLLKSYILLGFLESITSS